ncbi:transcriptional regulator, AraC family [Caldicellulosiruptor obsidiansis OB47]|uniref:Transcriptional regulator, AraC family n=1 Tax=Caldicellulosiruptor obsidiansis (strain ATCC BAA-2073 / JCM 16842 / OB47) TaxID=608506 RepID=D9TFV9_CALOO|nr:AraC family transcriptional regulator [Caldicellulosiruptor obsidiansis]ADL43079.1 transcriptional regulator, AraC family [Caldicellulosiruptor obsidiansis OB47]
MLLEKFKKSFVFKRFLISYVSILLIPLLLSLIVFNTSFTVVQKNSVNSTLFLLNQLKNFIDSKMEKIDEIAIKMAYDSKLQWISTLDTPKEGSPDVYWFWEYYNNFCKIVSNLKDELDISLLVAMRHSDTVYYNSVLYFEMEEFYKNNFRYSKMSFKQWYDYLFNTFHFKDFLPKEKVVINGENKEVITYTYSFPFWKKRNPDGVIAVFINEEKIRSLLSKIVENLKGNAYIISENGSIISSYLVSPKLSQHINLSDFDRTQGFIIVRGSRGRIIRTYVKSQINNWMYIVEFPIEMVMKEVYFLRNVATAVLLTALILGLLISTIFAYKNEKPISEILGILKLIRPVLNNEEKEFDIIKKEISNLIQSEIELSRRLETQQFVLREIFFERLLYGQYDDKSKIEKLIKYLNFNIDSKNFAIAIMRILREYQKATKRILNELDLYRISVEEILKKNYEGTVYLHPISENDIAVLVGFNIDDVYEVKKRAEDLFETVQREINEKFSITPLVVLGRVCQNLFDVQFAFLDAKEVLENISLRYEDIGNSIINADEWQRSNVIYYPLEIEEKIISLTLAGRFNDLRSLFDMLFEKNFKESTLSKNLKIIFLNELLATFIKVINKCDDTVFSNVELKELFVFRERQDLEAAFNQIVQKFIDTSKMMDKNKKSHNEKLIEKILEFINSNLYNSQMSISFVASHFDLSNSYFSFFFKEQTGMKFSDYIEKLRIEKACELLREEKYNIDEVAKMVGYTNAHTFRRAFKKVIGILPSEFCERLREV